MFGSPKWWLRPRIGRLELVLCINDLISVDARSLLMEFGMDSVITGEEAIVLEEWEQHTQDLLGKRPRISVLRFFQ